MEMIRSKKKHFALNTCRVQGQLISFAFIILRNIKNNIWSLDRFLSQLICASNSMEI